MVWIIRSPSPPSPYQPKRKRFTLEIISLPRRSGTPADLVGQELGEVGDRLEERRREARGERRRIGRDGRGGQHEHALGQVRDARGAERRGGVARGRVDLR